MIYIKWVSAIKIAIQSTDLNRQVTDLNRPTLTCMVWHFWKRACNREISRNFILVAWWKPYQRRAKFGCFGVISCYFSEWPSGAMATFLIWADLTRVGLEPTGPPSKSASGWLYTAKISVKYISKASQLVKSLRLSSCCW